jgi:hypothetical protein
MGNNAPKTNMAPKREATPDEVDEPIDTTPEAGPVVAVPNPTSVSVDVDYTEILKQQVRDQGGQIATLEVDLAFHKAVIQDLLTRVAPQTEESDD